MIHNKCDDIDRASIGENQSVVVVYHYVNSFVYNFLLQINISFETHSHTIDGSVAAAQWLQFDPLEMSMDCPGRRKQYARFSIHFTLLRS